MDLFELVGNRVTPSPHALLIPPFSTIWEMDKTINKMYATKIFSYIELLCSPKKSNPFAGYSEEERPAKVKKAVFGDEYISVERNMQSEIIAAVHKYRELLEASAPSYGLYVSAVNAVHKIRKFLDDFDFDERTPSGAMVLKPRDVTAALKELPDVEKTMQVYKDKIQGELMDATKTRNQRSIGAFER